MRVLDEHQVERLAQAIHEHYVTEQTRRGVSACASAAMVPWPRLSADLREANREQARDIVRKLATLGCALAPDTAAAGRAEFRFTAGELELLARQEQRRWRRQRSSAGWVYAPVRDDQAKQHPSLVSWSRLSESERNKDRDAVRNIPAVVATAGLRVVRA